MARPLSPHLSIFRPYINMTMSIFHRMTGIANYFGILLLAAWLDRGGHQRRLVRHGERGSWPRPSA